MSTTVGIEPCQKSYHCCFKAVTPPILNLLGFFVIVLLGPGQIVLQVQSQLCLHAAAETDFGCSLM